MDLGEFIRSKGYYEVRIYSGYYVGRKPRLNIQVPGDKNRKLKPTFFQRTGYIGPALSSAAICLIQDVFDHLGPTPIMQYFCRK